MTPILRFAPSPTGHLHIGNLRTALFNALFARREKGTFVLRFDDTDRERSRREYADAIETDLAWIGISPDRVIRQSERIPLYDEAAARLRDAGLLYPCYETPDELDRRRKRLAARNLPPVYGREALRLTPTERNEQEAAGRPPHWRFLLPNFAADPFERTRTDIQWHDLVHGEQRVDLASVSDPVLVRADGSYTYTLPSVVDDGAEAITHVVRGDDHVTNTGVQIAIFRALGLATPEFGHHNLLTTGDGEGLSKRSGALSLASLREFGFEPMAVASLAMLVGMSGSLEAVPDLERLAERLDLGAISTSASRFDPAELERLNADLVHEMPASAAAERLREMGVPDDALAAFWDAVRGNCTRVAEAAPWVAVVFADEIERVAPEEEDRPFLRDAAALLPEGEPGTETWREWTSALKARTGRKGRSLFMPLRLALTGRDHGPELAGLLPLMGEERIRRRLAA